MQIAESADTDRRLATGGWRLANQAFYTRLDITDDERLRPRFAEPFATIIREAHESDGDDGKGTEHEHDSSTHVACSRKTLWVVIRRSLSTPSAPLRSLITRSQCGMHSPTTRRERTSRRNQRGPVATKALKSQTRLSYPNHQKLLDAYASGMPVKQSAERFGAHRTTITQIVSSSGATMRNRPSPALQ